MTAARPGHLTIARPAGATWLAAFVCIVAVGGRAAAAEEPPDAAILRIFLTNGTAITSYGEYARVGDRVVFSMPLGALTAQPHLHLVNLPAGLVDWRTTEEYAESARYARFVATRAETEFALLSGQVAAALNSIALATDPARRLTIAEQARRTLVEWPRDHYGYRADDVIQIAGLLDEAITELRAAAGVTSFDLNLVATSVPPSVDRLRPLPSPTEAVEHAVMVARLSDVPAERLSLLQSIAAALSGSTGAFPEAWLKRTRVSVVTAIQKEVQTETAYARLSREMMTRASAYARVANVAGVEGVLRQVRSADKRLGGQRPDQVAALIGAIEERLDAARRLRLARDQWTSRTAAYKKYRSAVAGPLARLAGIQRRLEDIRALAGPSAVILRELSAIVARAKQQLARIGPPDDVRSTHALLLSAVSLADSAVSARREAVESGDLRIAWDASAAAAGSMMLLTRARSEVDSLLKPPQLR
jgi:hypothetical protein